MKAPKMPTTPAPPVTQLADWRLSLLAVLLPWMATGCSFAPETRPPAQHAPAQYGVQATPAATVAALGMAQQFSTETAPIPLWWRAYRSPEIDTLVAEGLANSPDLASAERSLAAAREQLQARIGSTQWPSLDIATQATRQDALNLPGFSPPTAQYNQFGAQLRAAYTLDLFGSVRYANAAAAARTDEQALRLEASRRALAANIVKGVIGSAALARQVMLAQQQVVLAEQVAHDTQRRHELGAASQTEALDARRNADALSADLPGLRAQWQASRHALAVLLGRTPDQAPQDLDIDAIALPEQLPLLVPSALLETRPDIRAAEAELRAAAADVGQATARLFPSLSLTAAYGNAGYTWSAASSNAIWNLGLSISQPLFQGGALRGERRAAQVQYQSSIERYRQTVLQAFREVADSLASLQADAQALASAEASRQAAEAAHRDTLRRVELGALPRYAGRASEQALLQARQRELNHSSTRLQDSATLLTAMGSPLNIQP